MLTTPPDTLSLLYRGTLASCNYACGYCPFAKKRDSRATLARDAREVARFTSWVAAQKRDIGILFTPWGEALVRRHYRAAMQTLASLPHVRQVALQTNLSGPLNWLQGMDGLEKSACGAPTTRTRRHWPVFSNAARAWTRWACAIPSASWR